MEHEHRTVSWDVKVELLRNRAERLRAQAADMSEPVAYAYRRRAAELDLEAFALGMALAPPGREPRVLAA